MNKFNKKIKFLLLGGTPYVNPLIGGLQAPRDWANLKLQEVKAASKEADRRNARHNLANKKSLKRYGYVNDITRILEELFNQGYFGKGVTYNQAVDGIWGKKTQAAWNKRKTEQLSKKELQNPYEGLTNIEAITKFKTINGVTSPYYIVDKLNNLLFKMLGNKILAKIDIMHGLNTASDGFTKLTKFPNGKANYDNLTNLMATGAGIWTIGSNSPYEGGRAYHLRRTVNKGEPYYLANDSFGAKLPIKTYNTKTQVEEGQAIHPMSAFRLKDFKKGIRNKSFGCINVQPDLLKQLNFLLGDSVYIIPGVKGNYMYVDTKDNHIKTHYSDTNNQKDNSNYGKKFHFSNINYNTSY